MADKRRFATLVGFGAVLMWSLLALFTAASGAVPPFQLTAMAFTISGLVGLAWIVATGRWRDLVMPWRAWLLGIGGLFGFHFLYFTSLRAAPPAEASLIVYLWPLLIVVFSAVLPGERLRWFHLAGAGLGLAGTAIVIARGRQLAIEPAFVAGYAAAVAAALTWAVYSVVSRRFADVPSGGVAGFCLATAVLSAGAHLGLETTVWPATGMQWLAVAGLGLMPVGAAFYVWDYGVKHGDIRALGASAYAAPLLSTAILIAAGAAAPSWSLAAAAGLITAGAVLAARDLLLRRRSG